MIVDTLLGNFALVVKMLKAAAKVCAILLVIIYFSEQCYSLEIYYEHEVNNELRNDEDLIAPETINYAGEFYKEAVTEIPKQSDDYVKVLFSENWNQDENNIENNNIEQGTDGSEDAETAVKNRVVRQAYPGSAPLYPKLPSSSPYYQQLQQYPNYNNQNLQWQPPNNNSQQQGYSTNSGSNFYPSSRLHLTHGYQSYNPSQSQNPYNNNNSPSQWYPGYTLPNSTVYNPGQNGSPSNSHGQFNSNPYPSYTTQTPGHRPMNTVTPYNPSQKAPYYPVTPNNGYPNAYTTNRPLNNNHNVSNWSGNTVRPPYNIPNGQNPQNFNSNLNNPYRQSNSTFPHNLPNQGPYHNPSNGYLNNSNNLGPYAGQKPQSLNYYPQGQNQNPYNNPSNGQHAGSNNYPGNSYYGSNTFNPANGYLNNPYRQPNSTFPHNVPNPVPYHNPSNGYHNNSNNLGPYAGQKPQSFNSYPQGQNQNPYNDPSNSQHVGSNNYPGNSYGSDALNLANGYNPSPPRPPYGTNLPGQNRIRYPPGSNGTAHDPTKVSPEYFSYPN